MCGIFIKTLTTNKDVSQCAESLSKLQGRGPESTRYIVDNGNIFIGFCRLPIIDLNGGDQPFVSGHNILVANAEIFNHDYVYPNRHCTSKSDCECILRAYESGQPISEIASTINGDFAFVLVTKDHIIACRDRVGIRPLFYGFKDGDLAISSEIKAFPPGFTIEHVKPSMIMTFNRENVAEYKTERYYGMHTDYYDYIPLRQKFIIECPCVNLKKLLTDSVKLRLESDRPVGCLLSGGLDSSIVALILSQQLGAKNVRTYSIGMEGSVDLGFARKVADFLGTDHHEIVFTAEEGIKAIPEVIYALESYDITTVRASIPMFLLGRWISKNTKDKVIFSGELSDELLCGYLYFHHAPSNLAAEDESRRLVKNVYKYDALRADRCISSHGLELRVPFADVNVINYCMFILRGNDKRPNNTIEKKILRDAFAGELPDEVLYRRKDGFSDGVSSIQKPWYTYIQESVEHIIITNEISKEAEYYKQIYNSYYNNVNYSPISEHWMPTWGIVDKTNPSGRVIVV